MIPATPPTAAFVGGSFRVFARLPQDRHTKICVFDTSCGLPDLKTLTMTVANKLKVSHKDDNVYQLLLDNQAEVEHVGELRDGDTVVLQITAPHTPMPLVDTAALVKEEPPSPMTSEGESCQKSDSWKPDTTTSNSRRSSNNESNESKTEEDQVGKDIIIRNSSSNAEDEVAKEPTEPGTADDCSVDSTKTIAHSAVKAAAADTLKFMSVDDDDNEDDDDDSTQDAKPAATPVPNCRRSKRLAEHSSEEKDKENKKSHKETKRRKHVTLLCENPGNERANHSSNNSNKKPEEDSVSIMKKVTTTDKPSEPPTPMCDPQSPPPEYAVGGRFFVCYYDGHCYPVHIKAMKSTNECQIQFEQSNIIKDVRLDQLLPVTPKLEMDWQYGKASSSASSVASHSSRETRSGKSQEFLRYGAPTNGKRVKRLVRILGQQNQDFVGKWTAERNRIVYFCLNDETPRMVIQKFPRMSMGKLLYDNRPLWGESMHETSKLQPGTPLIMPKTWHGRLVVALGNIDNPHRFVASSLKGGGSVASDLHGE